MAEPSRLVRIAAICLAGGVILVLTASPIRSVLAPLGRPDLSARMLADGILNVLLFVPFGAAAALQWRRSWTPVWASAVLSAAIEIAQLFIPGRYSTPLDVGCNVLGGLVGMMLVRTTHVWLTPVDRVRSRLAVIAVGFPALCLIGASALLAPVVPDEPLQIEWTPTISGSQQRYPGSVLSATFAPADAADPATIASRLLSGDTIRIQFVLAPPSPRAFPILRIRRSGRNEDVLVVGIRESHISVVRRLRAAALRLDQPELHALYALAGVELGQTVDLSVWSDHARSCAAAVGGMAMCLGPTVGSTWSVLYFPPPRGLGRLLSLLWISMLLAPAGFWIRRIQSLALVAGAFIVLFVSAPLWLPVVPTPIEELLAIPIGLIAGRFCARHIRRWLL